MGNVYSSLFITPPLPTTLFTDQTIIITGSNTGLGLEAARHFVRLSAKKVIIAVRNESAGLAAVESIESSTGIKGVCSVWPLDLASYESIQEFAAKVSTLSRVDSIILNAGIATTQFREVQDGNESMVGVNCIGTFLLGLLVLPILKQTKNKFNKETYLTIVTSEVHAWTSLPELQQAKDANQPLFTQLRDTKKSDMNFRYAASKLLQVLVVRALARRLAQKPENHGVVLNMLNPGMCRSSLQREFGVMRRITYFLSRETEVGARTLVLAASAGQESHGLYMTDGKVDEAALSKFVRSEKGEQAMEQVWSELSEILEGIRPGILQNI